MTIQQSLAFAAAKLRASASPTLDAEVLLSFAIKKPKEFLYAYPELELSKNQSSRFRALIRKRAHRWPVAYLTGHKEFFALDFWVTPDALIPRPDTELLVELATQAIGDKRLAIRNIIDVGTGSGSIIISLAHAVSKKLDFFAIDSSAKTLSVARRNARRHGVSHKIKFLRGNLISPLLLATSYLPRLASGKTGKLQPSLIIANLPYLTEKQYRANPDLRHEPKNALVGGKDGMKYFRGLLEQLHSYCHPGLDPGSRTGFRLGGRNDRKSIILLEHDPSQKNKIKKLISLHFPKTRSKFYKDLSGYSRVSLFEI